jgi:hypothetical protein
MFSGSPYNNASHKFFVLGGVNSTTAEVLVINDGWPSWFKFYTSFYPSPMLLIS